MEVGPRVEHGKFEAVVREQLEKYRKYPNLLTTQRTQVQLNVTLHPLLNAPLLEAHMPKDQRGKQHYPPWHSYFLDNKSKLSGTMLSQRDIMAVADLVALMDPSLAGIRSPDGASPHDFCALPRTPLQEQSEAFALLGHVLADPQQATDKKDETVHALARMMQPALHNSQLLSAAESKVPGCSANVALAILRGGQPDLKPERRRFLMQQIAQPLLAGLLRASGCTNPAANDAEAEDLPQQRRQWHRERQAQWKASLQEMQQMQAAAAAAEAKAQQPQQQQQQGGTAAGLPQAADGQHQMSQQPPPPPPVEELPPLEDSEDSAEELEEDSEWRWRPPLQTLHSASQLLAAASDMGVRHLDVARLLPQAAELAQRLDEAIADTHKQSVAKPATPPAAAAAAAADTPNGGSGGGDGSTSATANGSAAPNATKADTEGSNKAAEAAAQSAAAFRQHAARSADEAAASLARCFQAITCLLQAAVDSVAIAMAIAPQLPAVTATLQSVLQSTAVQSQAQQRLVAPLLQAAQLLPVLLQHLTPRTVDGIAEAVIAAAYELMYLPPRSPPSALAESLSRLAPLAGMLDAMMRHTLLRPQTKLAVVQCAAALVWSAQAIVVAQRQRGGSLDTPLLSSPSLSQPAELATYLADAAVCCLARGSLQVLNTDSAAACEMQRDPAEWLAAERVLDRLSSAISRRQQLPLAHDSCQGPPLALHALAAAAGWVTAMLQEGFPPSKRLVAAITRAGVAIVQYSRRSLSETACLGSGSSCSSKPQSGSGNGVSNGKSSGRKGRGKAPLAASAIASAAVRGGKGSREATAIKPADFRAAATGCGVLCELCNAPVSRAAAIAADHAAAGSIIQALVLLCEPRGPTAALSDLLQPACDALKAMLDASPAVVLPAITEDGTSTDWAAAAEKLAVRLGGKGSSNAAAVLDSTAAVSGTIFSQETAAIGSYEQWARNNAAASSPPVPAVPPQLTTLRPPATSLKLGQWQSKRFAAATQHAVGVAAAS